MKIRKIKVTLSEEKIPVEVNEGDPTVSAEYLRRELSKQMDTHREELIRGAVANVLQIPESEVRRFIKAEPHRYRQEILAGTLRFFIDDQELITFRPPKLDTQHSARNDMYFLMGNVELYPVTAYDPPKFTSNGHVVYENSDFTDEDLIEDGPRRALAHHVIECGLSICKLCGAAEADLDYPCKPEE